VSIGEAGPHTQVLENVRNHQADGKEDNDDARSVEHCPMNQRKYDGRKDMQRNNGRDGNLPGKNL